MSAGVCNISHCLDALYIYIGSDTGGLAVGGVVVVDADIGVGCSWCKERTSHNITGT